MAHRYFPSLEREIYNKVDIYSHSPKYHLKRKKLGSSNMTSKKHTDEWMIEHPQMQNKILLEHSHNLGKGTVAALKKEIKKGKKQVESAWNHLKSVNLALGGITHDILLDVAGRIDINNETYRRQRVSLGLNYTPPNYIKINQLLDEFFSEYNNFDGSHLEKALLSHITIAGIQPFADGNKRTARMIQNKTLSENDLPIVSIPYGERAIYISLLEEAMQGLNFYNGEQEHDYERFDKLFTYLGGKVNTEVDRIVNNI